MVKYGLTPVEISSYFQPANCTANMEKLRQHIEKITALTDEEFAHVQTFFTPKRVRKNQYLVHEGDEVKYEFLVLQGIYKVFYIDNDGKEHIVQFAQENWWMTDYIGYFKQKSATMFVECVEEGEVLCMTLAGREKLSSDLHKMENFFRVKLTNGYVALQQRIALLLSSTPQQRYETFCQTYPTLLQRLPKKMIAEFLGVSRETLSRLYSPGK
jgi:CRP/FNR family transcriptional regulator, anaerobic regulatory protein